MQKLKTLIGTAMLIGSSYPMSSHAQRVTYNHDSSKQNQVTVMETGSGALTPEVYYTLLHNSYRKSAVSKNKQSFRTLAGIALYNQTDDAEAIDSALTQRAKVEALNIADHSADIAWLAEGAKVEGKMSDFQANIHRIIQAGWTVDDQQRWTEYYRMYECAIKATKDAYMPSAQRKKMYLKIYADVARQNETLVKLLVQMHTAGRTKELLAGAAYRTANKGEIISSAHNRWREVGWRAGGNGNETKNR